MAWCAGGGSIWRNGSSRNSASRSPSRRSAGSCEPWATANYRPDRVTMRKPRARSRILKKLPRAPGGNGAKEGACPRHDRNLVRRRGPHRPEEQDHPPLGQARHPSKRTAGPTDRFHLHLRCSLPEGGQGCSPDHAGLQHRGDELAPRRDRRNRRARCPRHPPGRPSRLALVHAPPRAGQYHHHCAAAEVPRAQPGRERLAVHARQLALQPHLQILRRSRRPLLCGMEQARRPALAHHVHRTAPMGPRVLINGIWYKGKPKIDWSRVDAMTEAERHAAAMADPDARPMTDAEWARAPRVPQVSVIRRALKLSQEQFATTFHILIGTIRDWEQGRYEPDAAARAYLRVIAREPKTVRKALAARTK